MNNRSSPAPRRRTSPWLELSKNPLLILLLGTALGAIVVPQIEQRIARSRQRQELRTQTAIAIIKSNNDTNFSLNSILTAFEERFKDDSTLVSWNENLPSFRSKVYGLHEGFNQMAWRWCPETVKGAYLLRLMDNQSFRQSQNLCAEYDASLVRTMKPIDVAWDLLFQRRQSVATRDERDDLRRKLQRARSALRQSSMEREEKVSLLVHLLMGKDGSSL
jgi:hypothetical protein